MEARRQEKTDEKVLKVLRRGWCCGGEAFRREMLDRMEGWLGASHSGELRRESAEVRAARIVKEELKRLGWREEEQATRRKGDPGKLAMAARLRKETTLTLKSIAARLHLGTSQSANSRLHDWMRDQAIATKLPAPK